MSVVDVAAAVILRPDGAFLLGQRPPGKVYAGYWEFPGGKVEAGETPRAALERELREELGIVAECVQPWLLREFSYEHAEVRLHFFRVRSWTGELRELQHSALLWQYPGNVVAEPLLPANAPILAALTLPDFYAITQAATLGVDAQMSRLLDALSKGLRLVQLRESSLAKPERSAFVFAATELCHHFGARVLVNGDAELAHRAGADGLHLTAAQLVAATERPDFKLVGASCHDALELAQAGRLGLDFAVLGPVRQTASHPERAAMGWGGFEQTANATRLPVFALGGVCREDMEAAWAAGAHGIAAIRAAWR